MGYWLFKSEPFKFSWDMLKAKGEAGQEWDGVRNYQARNNMRAMKEGDKGFFYHSNEGLSVVGIVEVAGLAHPDSTSDNPAWECVDIRAVCDMPQPVTLVSVKDNPALAEMALVRLMRLSVQPVTEAEYLEVCHMGGLAKTAPFPMKKAPEIFIRENTAILSPPHVPEIRLHMADEAHALWHKTEEELGEAGLPPPFWAFAWAGGQGLARYILDHKEEFAGKRIVDFASGSGLVAIAAAFAGSARVLAADIDPWAGSAVRLNAALNGVDVEFTGENLVGQAIDCDMMLAGDVFYDKAMAELLIDWFSGLARKGVKILVGDPGRAYCPKDFLEPLGTYEVPVTRALEDADVKKTTVWRFR